MTHRGHQSEAGGYIDQTARVGWDERGSFGFDVLPRTARDMTAAEHFWSDYAVVPLPDVDVAD